MLGLRVFTMVVDTLRTVFELDDKYSAKAKQAVAATLDLAKAQDQVTGVGTGDGSGGLAGYFKLATAELDSAIPGLQEFVSVLKAVGIAAVGAGVAFAGLTAYGVVQFAQFEQLTIALKVYAKTEAELERQLLRLREVAAMPGLGFAEAIQGSVRLQAIGFDARLAERALMAFGNALVSAGAGKSELDGVILGLSQIVSKGKISAEEINQIAERMPQFRDILKGIYGTGDSEQLQKMGVSVEKFVTDVVDALEKLPKAAGGAQNNLDNFMDTLNRLIVQFGRFSAKALLPALDALEQFGSYLERHGIVGQMVERMYSATSATSTFAASLREAAGIVKDIGDGVGEAATKADHLGGGLQGLMKEFGDLLSQPVGFLSAAEDFGDFLVRGAALAVVTLGKIPEIFDAATMILSERMEAIRDFVNGLIEVINGVIGMMNKGVSVMLFGQEIGHIGGDGTIPTIAAIGAPGAAGGAAMTEGERKLSGIIESLVNDARAIYEASKKEKPQSTLDGDKSKGGIRGGSGVGGLGGSPDDGLGDALGNAISSTEANTRALERNNRLLVDLNRQLQGGGAFAEAAVSDLAIARATRRPSGGMSHELQMAMEYLERHMGVVAGQHVRGSNRRLTQAGAL